MDSIVEIGSAATVAALVVALFKLAWPTSPSWALVLAAVVGGIGSSFLVAAAGGEAVWGLQAIAGTALQGIFAAAAAAGVTRTDARANVVRADAQRDALVSGQTTGVSGEPAEPPRAA